MTPEYLRKVLDYDPRTGIFRWKVKHCNSKVKGAVAGYVRPEGYRVIKTPENHYAHRLAWLYVYGEWPKQIDHINGKKDDNRIENLRELPQQLNAYNRGANKNNILGVKGVSKRRAKYSAVIKHNGKNQWLGTFDTVSEASAAYEKALRRCTEKTR